MPDQEKSKIAEEAADLFLRMQSDPENAQLIAERDAFLARGATEKKAYDAVQRAWSGVKPSKPKNKFALVLFAALLGGLALASADPLQTYLLADYTTKRTPDTVAVPTGDRIDLDASTALRDLSDEDARKYTVLDGAAVFDVASETRPFLVELGPVTVRVTGTVFETAHQSDGFAVSVIEGSVEVTLDQQTWHVSDGMGFAWSEEMGPRVETLPPQSIATWRQGRLIATGMSFADVVDVIDRRLPGQVWITNGSLGAQPVSGIIDLSDPALALRTLVLSQGARATSIGPFGKIIHR